MTVSFRCAARASLVASTLIASTALAQSGPLPGPGPAATSVALSPGASSVEVAERRELVAVLAKALTDDYNDPAIGQQMASAVLKAERRGDYRAIQSGSALADRLTSDLRAVSKDQHLRVMFEAAGMPPPPGATISGPGIPKDVRRYFDRQNARVNRLEVLDGNVGYLKINEFQPSGYVEHVYDAAIAFLTRTDALIIDLRDNIGGDARSVAYLLSHLLDGGPRPIQTVYWRATKRTDRFSTTDLGDKRYGGTKPVIVLTSKRTFSAGEEFAYDVKAMKRGTIVGETTAGAANPVVPRPLTKRFAMAMPTGRAVNAITGTNWEGTGVAPDVAVPANQALARGHAIALERLAATTTDPTERRSYEAALIPASQRAGAINSAALTLEQVAGRYNFPAVPGAAGRPGPEFIRRDGRLYQLLHGAPESLLIPAGGNRYKVDGFPEGFFTSFEMRNGRVVALLEQPDRAAMIFDKAD